MQLPPFKLERYFAKYEFQVRYLLSASDCEALAMRELLEMADAETRALWENLALAYTESRGHPLLLEEIARLYTGLAPENVLTAAPEEAIFIAMNVLLAPGDHVVAAFPAYQSLYELARAIGAGVTRWSCRSDGSGWRFDLDELAHSITPRTRLLVINFPHNPTGHLPARAELDAIVDLARRHDLVLFSDEMYRYLEYDPARRLPSLCELYAKAVSMGGLSKSFALPGLRLGWLASQDRALLERCSAFKDYTTICASAPGEILAIAALRAREAIIARNLAIVQANLAAADAFFGRHTERFDWLRPQAGSIAFPRLRGDEPVERFCQDFLARESTMLVPGTIFDFPGNHFRLGLGRMDFGEALARLEAFVQSS